jgi:hypothetical protein
MTLTKPRVRSHITSSSTLNSVKTIKQIPIVDCSSRVVRTTSSSSSSSSSTSSDDSMVLYLVV